MTQETTLTQRLTEAGNAARALHLVYDTAGPHARLVAVADTPPPTAIPLPGLECEAGHMAAIRDLAVLMPRIAPHATPTHAQVVYGSMRTSGEMRRITLLWAIPDHATIPAGAREARLADLFAHGGHLVAVTYQPAPAGLPWITGRRIRTGAIRALSLLATPDPAAIAA